MFSKFVNDIQEIGREVEGILNDLDNHLDMAVNIDELKKNPVIAAAEHALTSPFRQNDFKNALEKKFGPETTQQVLNAFDKLGIPPPKSGTQFLNAYDGTIAFTNDYGMAIRVEPLSSNTGTRMNDNPWVLQPVAEIDAGKARVEICPGCNVNDKHEVAARLREEIGKTGGLFWDMKANNTGILPLKTPSFPDGIPVVIDRLAVRGPEKSENVSQALATMGVTRDPQEVLYGDLRKSFRDAWPKGAESPHPGLMKKFWADCKETVAQGRVVEGWNQKINDKYKIGIARNSAAAYTGGVKAQLKGPEATKFDKPDLSTPLKIMQYQDQIIKADKVLPETVTLKGTKMPLSVALRDGDFNAHFKQTLEKVHKMGGIDMMAGPMQTINAFDKAEVTRRQMVASMMKPAAPKLGGAGMNMAAGMKAAAPVMPAMKR